MKTPRPPIEYFRGAPIFGSSPRAHTRPMIIHRYPVTDDCVVISSRLTVRRLSAIDPGLE